VVGPGGVGWDGGDGCLVCGPGRLGGLYAEWERSWWTGQAANRVQMGDAVAVYTYTNSDVIIYYILFSIRIQIRI
jgi:hypothetical protein